MGNSKGIRIPKITLAKYNITEEVNLLVDDNNIVIQIINKKFRVEW